MRQVDLMEIAFAISCAISSIDSPARRVSRENIRNPCGMSS